MTITLQGPATAELSTSTTTVSDYLGRRLLQAGVEHVFGVPGDFNLNLLDGLATVSGLDWTGSPNELGAAYAADAYARSRGLAALVTTYGVGELSCLNALAGSAAEDVPVLHIVGSPATRLVRSGALVHHTLGDGVFDRFERASAPFTVSQQTLTTDDPGAQIDAAILAAVTERRPVYLSIPQDLAGLSIDAGPLADPLQSRSDAVALRQLTERLRRLLGSAERPVIVVGHLVNRYGLRRELAALAHAARIPVVTQLSAKGTLDEDDAWFYGDYAGTMTPDTAGLVDDADVVLYLGTAMTDVLTGQFTARGPDDRSVQLHARWARVGSDRFEQVLFPDAVRALTRVCVAAGSFRQPPAGRVETVRPSAAAGQVTQQAVWNQLEDWLPSGTALLADTGTAFWGAMSMRIPADTVVVSQPIWNSIGYALSAVVGQGLAEPGRRPVLVVGDGAAQMTVQDLSTMAAAVVRPVVILLNNHGYTIERALQSPLAAYNDVPEWDWSRLVSGLAGTGARHLHVTTTDELQHALAVADRHTGLLMIEVELDRLDTPPLLTELAARSASPSPPTTR